MASQDQLYRAAEAESRAEEKTKDQLTLPEMGQSTAPVAGKKKSGGGGGGGVMRRTGEQVKSMAQGAADKVKQSFGLAELEEEDDEAAAAAVGGKTDGATAARTATGRTN